MTEHVPHWPFIDGTIVAKQKMRQGKKKVIKHKGKAENVLFKMIFWKI